MNESPSRTLDRFVSETRMALVMERGRHAQMIAQRHAISPIEEPLAAQHAPLPLITAAGVARRILISAQSERPRA